MLKEHRNSEGSHLWIVQPDQQSNCYSDPDGKFTLIAAGEHRRPSVFANGPLLGGAVPSLTEKSTFGEIFFPPSGSFPVTLISASAIYCSRPYCGCAVSQTVCRMAANVPQLTTSSFITTARTNFMRSFWTLTCCIQQLTLAIRNRPSTKPRQKSWSGSAGLWCCTRTKGFSMSDVDGVGSLPMPLHISGLSQRVAR